MKKIEYNGNDSFYKELVSKPQRILRDNFL